MHNYLDTCPIKQVYDSINYNYTKQVGISFYEAPKTCLNLFSDKQKFKSTSQVQQKSIIKQQKNKQNQINIEARKLIPSNKSYVTQNVQISESKLFSNTSVVFGKQKKQSSYIPKRTSTEKVGPCTYDSSKAYNYLERKQSAKYPFKFDKQNCKRRTFSEGIAAKSIQVPGIGQYSIGNLPSTQSHCHLSQWAKCSRVELTKKHTQVYQQSKKKQKSPGPSTYTPIPRTYSLFSTLKTEEKDKLKFNAFNRREKQSKQKANKNKSKNPVGPGKYLSIDDWKQKLHDKKGQNFVSRIKVSSVYR